MSYRCLNCGHYSDKPDLSADSCELRGCGFKVGRFVWDQQFADTPSGLPVRNVSEAEKWWRAAIWLAVGVIGYNVGVWLADTGFNSGSYNGEGLGLVGVFLVIGSVVAFLWGAGAAVVLLFMRR